MLQKQMAVELDFRPLLFFGGLRSAAWLPVQQVKYLNDKCKGTVFSALVVSILLHGSESWCLREDLLRRLTTFYNRCVRMLCRVTMHQVIKHRISTKQLLKRLGICSIEDYYNSRLLRWTGHVARMSMRRTPRQLLTGWVRHPRPVGAPQMTSGRTINKALTELNLPTKFDGGKGWRLLAQDRATWRRLTQPDPAVREGKVEQRRPARRPARPRRRPRPRQPSAVRQML